METPTQPQASVAPSAVGALLLACATYGANPNLSCAHVSAFRCFGVSRFRRCFGLVSGSLCEIVNKDAVCFGVSAFAPIFLQASTVRGTNGRVTDRHELFSQ